MTDIEYKYEVYKWLGPCNRMSTPGLAHVTEGFIRDGYAKKTCPQLVADMIEDYVEKSKE